jgi:hypothetical protein
MIKLSARTILVTFTLIGLAIFNVGCPNGGGGTSSNGELVVLFATDGDTKQFIDEPGMKTTIDKSNIHHLSFNVKSILLYSTTNPPVTLFDGSKRVNILDRLNFRDVLSQALVPPGNYGHLSGTVTLIEVVLQDPLLVLTSDTETIITDVTLAGGDTISVTGYLPILEDTDSLCTFDLGDFDLVQNPDTSYTMNHGPAHVTIDSDPLEARMTGTLTGLNKFADYFAIEGSPGVIQVDYSAAQIIKADETPGTEDDLILFDPVRVRGIIDAEGNLYASYVFMLDFLL